MIKVVLLLLSAAAAVSAGYLEAGDDVLEHRGYESLGSLVGHDYDLADHEHVKYSLPQSYGAGYGYPGYAGYAGYASGYAAKSPVVYAEPSLAAYKTPVTYASAPVEYAKAPAVVYADHDLHEHSSPVVYAKAPAVYDASPAIVHAPSPAVVHAPSPVLSYAASPVTYAVEKAVPAIAVAAPHSYDLGHELAHDLGHGVSHGAILEAAVPAVAAQPVYDLGRYGEVGVKTPLTYASYGHVGHSLYDGDVAYGHSYGYKSVSAHGTPSKVHGYTSVVKGPHSFSYQSVHKEDVPYGYASHYGYAGHGLVGGELHDGGLLHGGLQGGLYGGLHGGLLHSGLQGGLHGGLHGGVVSVAPSYYGHY